VKIYDKSLYFFDLINMNFAYRRKTGTVNQISIVIYLVYIYKDKYKKNLLLNTTEYEPIVSKYISLLLVYIVISANIPL